VLATEGARSIEVISVIFAEREINLQIQNDLSSADREGALESLSLYRQACSGSHAQGNGRFFFYGVQRLTV